MTNDHAVPIQYFYYYGGFVIGLRDVCALPDVDGRLSGGSCMLRPGISEANQHHNNFLVANATLQIANVLLFVTNRKHFQPNGCTTDYL